MTATGMTGEVEADPERLLALSYAPPQGRGALVALLALDDALGQVLRTTSEPALGQMRLAWWREALARLDHAPAPAEPVLTAIAREVLPLGIRGSSLVPVVHGWETLIEEDVLDEDAARRFGEGRGHLFVAAGEAMSAAPGDPLLAAGAGWALADLARNLRGEGEVDLARRMAVPLLDRAAATRWSRNGRALGALALLARLDLRTPDGTLRQTGVPHRVARLLWHRLTGR